MVALVTVTYSHMFSTGSDLDLILVGSEQTLVCVDTLEFPFSPEAARGVFHHPHERSFSTLCDVSAHKVVFIHSYLHVCVLLLLSSTDPLT